MESIEKIATTKLEAIYNILKEKIVTGVLAPGSRLIIRKIAGEYGISESPVREAIRMLEAQGLVTMIPHAGAQVAELDKETIKEIIEARSVLEGYAARSAVSINKENLMKLQSCVEGMKKYAKLGDYVEFGKMNLEFHKTITSHIENQRIKDMIYEMLNECERTRAVFGLSAERLKKSIDEHEEIIKVLLEGNPEEVEKLVRLHRQRAGQALLDLI